MNLVNIELGNNIKLRRKIKNTTREKLAEKINVSPRFLAEVEAGKVGVSIQTLVRISEALGVSTDYLLGLTADVENNEYNLLVSNLKKLNSEYYPMLSKIIEELEKLQTKNSSS